MAQSTFYGICRWVQDDVGTFRKSVEMEVTLASGITYSDHASEDKPQPEAGDPVLWVVTFPKSDDYATMLEGTCPHLTPAASDIFTFCTKTEGGSVVVCDYAQPTSQQWIDDLMAYLAYWFPALHTQARDAGLAKEMKRTQIVDALSQIINPAIAAITGA